MNPPAQFTERKSVLPSADDIRKNPFCLDGLDLGLLNIQPHRIVTNEPLTPLLDTVPVCRIAFPSLTVLRRIPLAGAVLEWSAAFCEALCLLLALRNPHTAGIISLGQRAGSLFCFLRSFKLLKGGPVLVYRALLPAKAGRFQSWFIRRALSSADLIAVWSRAQIENYHRTFGIAREKFIFLPYKANHSSQPSKPVAAGDYIFSGGNSERDYRTLFEAVRGLPVQVIVSTTKPERLRGLVVPENVIVVGTKKHGFERLMAGSRMVALCLNKDMIRGSGEATFLNAMWHGKPVVIADDISARDYVQDGVDGYIVPAGDAAAMRRRIEELLLDSSLAARLGEAARQKTAGLYTHDQYKARLQTLALLVFARQIPG